jgi:uncharacterized protein YndB with AHSA1/START domain
MKSARSGSVQVHIDAPAQRVWAVLSDLERMGEWSPECYRVEWLDGAHSPATPGARFKGWNRFGWMRWSMPCEVKTAVADQELSFSTMARGRELVTWSYRIDPSEGGVDLVESFDVHWLPLSARIAEDFLMRDRDRRREESMRKTLEGIKQLAEDGSGS